MSPIRIARRGLHYTLAEIAGQKGCTPRAVRLAVSTGRLAAIRSEDGRIWLVAARDAKRWWPNWIYQEAARKGKANHAD